MNVIIIMLENMQCPRVRNNNIIDADKQINFIDKYFTAIAVMDKKANYISCFLNFSQKYQVL